MMSLILSSFMPFTLVPAASADTAPPAAPDAPAPTTDTMPTPAAAAMPAVPATITVAPPTRIVTLSDALSAALSDPDVATRWRVSHDQAAQDVALARAAREPQFSSTLRVRTRNTSNLVDVAPDQTGFVGEKSRVSLTAAMPLYDGGRTTDAIHAADAGLRATDQSVRAARIHVTCVETRA